MPHKVHLIAGFLAITIIALFFFTTILVELFGSRQTVSTVKNLIVFPGLFILIPSIAATGGSGFTISKSRKSRLIDIKRKRMVGIAANGFLILVPCAIVLNRWASNDSINSAFYIVQSIELLAGAMNITLMALNIRDGLKMSGRFKVSKRNAV